MRLSPRSFALGALVIFLCALPTLAMAQSPSGHRDAQISAEQADLESAERTYTAAEQTRKQGNNAAAQKSYAIAFKELTPLAKEGNAQAEVLLGTMYLMGYSAPVDPDRADKLFTAAAQQGNADAQFFLGARSVLHHQNVANGMKWLELSAGQGNQDAQLLLGRTYLQGIQGAVARDPIQADKWLRLAAKDNLPFYKLQLEGAERQMSAADVAKGQTLAAAWKPRTSPAPPKN